MVVVVRRAAHKLLSEAVVDELLAQGFGNWHVDTADEVVQVRITKTNKRFAEARPGDIKHALVDVDFRRGADGAGARAVLACAGSLAARGGAAGSLPLSEARSPVA